jgi:protein TonB
MRNHNIIIGLAFAAEVLLFNSAHAQSGVPDNDYPTESLKAGEQGTVEFKVDVNADGRAENCVILKSSGFPRLDKATCDVVVRRARFKPASDGNGAPIRGTWSNKMNWVIPHG